MAGGTFKLSQPKTRPGTYVNLKNGRARRIAASERGVATIPLIGYDYGPRGEFLKLTNESPDAFIAQFGRSVNSDNSFMLMLRLMLSNATTVYAYIPDGGTKATKQVNLSDGVNVTFTAMYNGTRGNKIKIASVANPVSGFDVSVYMDGEEVELFEGITTVQSLVGLSSYVTVSGTGAMAAFASVSLESGTDTVTGNSGISDYLDKCEKIRFNCMAFPTEDTSLRAALLAKIKYLRETVGWKCQAVAPNFPADYEGIINLTNSFAIDDTELTTAQACAWMAGATAGADYTTSLTYATVVGATKVVGELTNEGAIAAIKAGKTFFSVSENDTVILEYDINSLVTFPEDKPADMNKNRPVRVYDSWCNDCMTIFVPGRYDNSEDGWTVIEGIGRALLQMYANDGAITNVDLENDFLVDTERSIGDSLYIDAGLQAVDSADKYYITTIAR